MSTCASRLGLVASMILLSCSSNELGYLAAPEGGDMTHAPAPRARFDTRQRAACGPGGVTEAGAAAFVRRPYVQKVTADSAEIVWATVSGEPVRVEVRDGGGALVAQAQAERVTNGDTGLQVARLSGLVPDTTHCYQILGDSAWTEPTGMRTAPRSGVAAPVRFAVFGDVGKRSSDQFAVLEQIESVEFDAALITGDLAYEDGTRAELQKNFFDVYAELMARTAFFPATGNHDYCTDEAQPFRDAFFLFENGGTDGPEGSYGIERWYSLDWGDAHIVVLDTQKVGDVQARWLERDLAANTLPWVIVVGHRPPYSSGSHGSAMDVRERFSPLFERYGVDLALFGHEHNYERTESIGGVTYVITGGAGRGTRAVGTSGFTAFSARVAHFVYLTIEADVLRLYAIDATGRDFDTLELTRGN
jgi:acid phosphatase type 7